MKSKNIAPKYYIFRILLVSYLMYAIINAPFSINIITNFFISYINQNKIEVKNFSVNFSNLKINIQENTSNNTKTFIYKRNNLQNYIYIIIILIFIIINLPFKIYFLKLRKEKPINEKLKVFVRKNIYKTPIINSIILFGTPFIINLYFFFSLKKNATQINDLYFNLLKNQSLILIFSSIMIFIFVYYWQKNRVQFIYLEYIFSEDELQVPQTKLKQKVSSYIKIIYIILLISPIIIVSFFLISSFVHIRDIGLKEISPQAKEILFYKIPIRTEIIQNSKITPSLIYIPVFNTYLLILGLITSAISLIIYLIFFIRWTNRLLLLPIYDLLTRMRQTTGGNFGQYAIVRNNDELGQLSTEYNFMVDRLNNYFKQLQELNQNLEQRVKERTRTIEEQKAEIEAQRDQLLEKNKEIEFQKKEITDSILSAARIQAAIIPSEQEFLKHFKDGFVIFLPRDIVSGDFYWIKQFDEYIIFAAGDCTGHGVPGALMSALSISFLNEIVTPQNANNPGQILNQMREKIKYTLHQKENTNTTEGLDIALCSIQKSSLKLFAEGANNPIFIIRNRQLFEIKATKNPVGIFIKEKSFKTKTFQLKQKDKIYLFSDGYFDQFDENFTHKFSRKRFKELLVEISSLNMKEQKQILMQKFLQWKGQGWQIDDILVIGVEI